MAKPFVTKSVNAIASQPAKHLNATAFAFVTPAMGANPTLQFFSICEIRFGGAAILDNHKDADHCYFILSGRGYSIIDGKRYEYGPNDVLWIPGNKDHEMYPIGLETLRFVVTLTPAPGGGKPFRATEPFVRNIYDVEGVVPPLHENSTAFPIVTPKNGGSDSIEFHVTEIRPGGAALKDNHPNSDHVYYILSGRGYSIIDGERYDFGPGDALYIPMGSDHEMYPVGDDTLKFIVTFTPAR